jgi:CcmD family protein
MDPHTISVLYARNFQFMFFGFAAAWVIVALYVISLARRGARLKKELEDVRRLIASEGDDPHLRV